MRRMWINQPSTLQPDHALHGRLVLCDPEARPWFENNPPKGDERRVTVFFTDGDVVNQNVFWRSLASGWPAHLRRAPMRLKTYDHSQRTTKYWQPGLGPCVCEDCSKLPY